MHLFRDLERREKAGRPVMATVIGAGFFGAGVIRQLLRTPGMRPAIIANRTVERTLAALERCGVDRKKIEICANAASARNAISKGHIAVTSHLELPLELREIEVVVETTGNIEVGAELAFKSIQAEKHFVAANPETQATVGGILRREADKYHVIYSDMDGDQPGILKKLYDYVEGIGFEPVVAGNCKGVMKRYATPETQKAFCAENPIQPWIAVAAADGTKLNFEQCLIANAAGMTAAKTGMTGLQTTVETLIADFEKAGLLGKGRIVEYTLGIPVGVFVIGKNDNPWIQEDMKYFKMGNGPHYLFFSPHVLCQFDAAASIAEAVLYGEALITPLPELTTHVVTVAKQDLSSGKKLDGIGGFDCYGEIANYSETPDALPVGLNEFVRLKHSIEKDQPIRWSDVEIIESNFLIELYQKQQAYAKAFSAAS